MLQFNSASLFILATNVAKGEGLGIQTQNRNIYFRALDSIFQNKVESLRFDLRAFTSICNACYASRCNCPRKRLKSEMPKLLQLMLISLTFPAPQAKVIISAHNLLIILLSLTNRIESEANSNNNLMMRRAGQSGYWSSVSQIGAEMIH